MEISTSILTVDAKNATKTFYNLEVAGTDYYHIDVMDGKFVEKNTKTQMLEYATTIKQISNIPLDVHLMVEDIKENIDEYLGLEPSIITFHYEACKNKQEVFNIIKYLKSNNIKPSISIKPNTPVSDIYEFLPLVHMCLIMTVEPGKGGQTLITDMLEKISTLKKYIDQNNLEIDIEVDGGINLKTAPRVKEAGANILVAGTAILAASDYSIIINELKN